MIAVDGPPEDLLLSALRTGIFLTAPEIENILDARKLGKPADRTGKKKLRDAKYLIEKLFPEAADQDKAFMVASLMSKKRVKVEEAPQLLLKLVAALDVREAEQFSRVKMRAADDLALAAMKEKRARSKKQMQNEDHDESGIPMEEREPGQAKRKRDEQSAAASRVADPSVGPSRVRASGSGGSHMPAAGEAAGGSRVRAQRVKAPPELMDFLPNINKLYLRWQPGQKRVMAEFPPAERNPTFTD